MPCSLNTIVCQHRIENVFPRKSKRVALQVKLYKITSCHSSRPFSREKATRKNAGKVEREMHHPGSLQKKAAPARKNRKDELLLPFYVFPRLSAKRKR